MLLQIDVNARVRPRKRWMERWSHLKDENPVRDLNKVEEMIQLT